MLAYRKATLSDVRDLAELRVAMLCDGTDQTDGFRQTLRNNTERYITMGLSGGSYVTWVAEDGGLIIAMVGVTFFSLPPNDWCPDGKTAYIGNMYTLPEYRWRGIATRLLELIVGEATKGGCERILLHTTEMGRPIYEKFGFSDSESAMAYYPNRRI